MKQNIQAVIFDLGGTLIDYEGMPHYWGDFYEPAFRQAAERLSISLSAEQMHEAIDTLKTYNPRLYPREVEYESDLIFRDVLKSWKLADPDALEQAVEGFFAYFQRRVTVFPDTLETLDALKRSGCQIGVLTDVPTGMPSHLIKRDIAPFADRIDCFVTSIDCGFRKPNPTGIYRIAEQFGVEPSSLLFVGDEEKDMQAARNAGAAAVRINRAEPDRQSGDVIQIRSLISLTCWVSPL